MTYIDVSTNGVRNSEIDHVSVKIPTSFQNHTLWFKQVEASFKISKISEETTKYFHLISNLPASLLSKYEFLLDSESEQPYSNLKEAIIFDFENTRTISMTEIMKNESLGDRTPSEALRNIASQLQRLDKAVDPYNSSISRELFMRLLPKSVQDILLSMPDSDLRHLASTADKIVLSKRQFVTNIETPITPYNEQDDQIMQLQQEVYALNQRFSATEGRRLCFYHQKFGSRAMKCEHPCEWKDSKFSEKCSCNNKRLNQGNERRFH